MPQFTCHCGRGFFLPQKKVKQLASGVTRFCSPACLLGFIRGLPDDQPSTRLWREDFLGHVMPVDNGYWCAHLNRWYRSRSEAVVAVFFVEHDINAGYELGELWYGNDRHFPDFFLLDKDHHIEVKGPWAMSARKKFERIAGYVGNLSLIPDYLVRMIDKELTNKIK